MMPELFTNARDLLRPYPVIFCDVWGVLHDGAREQTDAGDALERYRAGGGTVVLLSNAPVPAATVALVLDEKGVRRSAWDAIVTSGDLTRRHVRARGYTLVHHVGPNRSLPLFEGLGTTLSNLADAEAIVCTGLVDDRNETGESYRPLLSRALARNTPLVCANPDLVVEVGGILLPCAGATAKVYANMGGDVYWAGKPHKPAYDLAFDTAERLLGRTVQPGEVIAIGDAIATDIAGAAAAGVDAIFIAGGIHRDLVMQNGNIDADSTERLLAGAGVGARAAMAALKW